MTVNTAIYTQLSGDATLSALVSTRIYPVNAPQDAALPLVVYQRVSGPVGYSQSGATGLTWPRYQFVCKAATFDGVRAVADALYSAMDGFTGTVSSMTIHKAFKEFEADRFHDAINEWITQQDYIIWHQE